jgi:serine/threonine protein kinase/tetratricopeptide (TPR) repeat protein
VLPNEEAARSAARMIGKIFAERYRIVSVLGQGGMGVVYKAEHTLIGRAVAIKMLLPEVFSDNQSIMRFRQEARAASALTHPNIVTVYDFGVTPNREVYLVMDFLNGKSLDAILAVTPVLSPDLFGRIFIQVCEALKHAHSYGIVHRDIKTSNIMLVDTQIEKDVVKIVDFGLAKLVSPEFDQQLTTVGTVMGSPVFMSPEQCRGLHCDERSDIYSLGCVMYRSLTGRMPIKGETALDTMNQHISTTPLPLSQANPAAGIPDRLESLVMKMLAKDPAQRPQSMGDVGNELNRFFSSFQRPTNTSLANDNTMPVSSAEAQAFDLRVSGATISDGRSFGSSPTEAAERAAKANAANASASNTGDGRATGQSTQADAPQVNVMPTKSKTKAYGMAAAAVLLTLAGVFAANLNDRTADEPSRPSTRPDPVTQPVMTAPHAVTDVPPKSSMTASKAPHGEHPAQLEAKHAQEAVGNAKTAAAPPKSVVETKIPAKDWKRLAVLPRPSEGKSAEPKPHLHDQDKETLTRLEISEQAARIAFEDRRFAKAEDLYRKCLNDKKAMLGKDNPDLLPEMTRIMACCNQQRHSDQSVVLLDQALALFQRGKNQFAGDPDVLFPLAATCSADKRYAEAVGFYRPAIAIRRKTSGFDPRGIVMPLNGLARAYIKLGKNDEAQKTLKQAMEISEKNNDRQSYDVSRNLLIDLLDKPNEIEAPAQIQTPRKIQAPINSQAPGPTAEPGKIHRQNSRYFHTY